ncbi:MAG: ribosome small subunit-dependent GTPase A [Syntrophothermus sp.]
MLDGVVVRAYSGFYYVQLAGGETGATVECTLRGKFRQRTSGEKVRVKKSRGSAGKVVESAPVALVGDRVKVRMVDSDHGVIEAIEERSSELTRPALANVEQVVIVFAVTNPEPNLALVDRLLTVVAAQELEIILCFNKIDLADPQVSETLVLMYKRAGYRVIPTSAKKGTNVVLLREALQGRLSTFAGPSGVGKSALLNAVSPGHGLVTGQVSEKIHRGKHTTRYAQLLPLEGGGWVADTPGFSQLELAGISPEELSFLFPEFEPFIGQCRFHPCFHDQEPGCAVKKALQGGGITPLRYEHYLEFMQELRAQKVW